MKLLSRLSLLFALVLLFGCTDKRSMKEPPQVVYELTDYDIGTVYLEDTVHIVKMKVSNGGGQCFRFIDVVSSCDCTKTEFDKEPLYHGDESTIKVTLNPSLLDEGAFERMIGVYTDLKKRPDTLYFHGIAKHK